MWKILSFLSFLLVVLAVVQVGAAAQQQVQWGTKNYTQYIPGDLPIILTAPHGGTILDASIPDRVCSTCTTVRDVGTIELVNAMSDFLYALVGKRPHVVILYLSRRKLDANRPVEEAALGNELAIQVYNDFHGYINQASDTITSACRQGLLIDIHGQAHPEGWIELGYVLEKETLDYSSDVLETMASNSSIRNLASYHEGHFVELLRGNESFGALLQGMGYSAIPSPLHPGPNGGNYFDGGYITQIHGSRDGGVIDGIQIESPQSVRLNAAPRIQYAKNLATLLQTYTSRFYPAFLENACQNITRPHGGPNQAALIAINNAFGSQLGWNVHVDICGQRGVTCNGATGEVDYIYLANAGLSGALPSELFTLTALTYLNLKGNQLTGPISADISKLTKLMTLNLSSNQLTGTLPSQLQLLSLQNLFLSSNPLCYNANYSTWVTNGDFSDSQFCLQSNCPTNFGSECSTCTCLALHGICDSGIAGSGTCSSCFTFWTDPNCETCPGGHSISEPSCLVNAEYSLKIRTSRKFGPCASGQVTAEILGSAGHTSAQVLGSGFGSGPSFTLAFTAADVGNIYSLVLKNGKPSQPLYVKSATLVKNSDPAISFGTQVIIRDTITLEAPLNVSTVTSSTRSAGTAASIYITVTDVDGNFQTALLNRRFKAGSKNVISLPYFNIGPIHSITIQSSSFDNWQWDSITITRHHVLYQFGPGNVARGKVTLVAF